MSQRYWLASIALGIALCFALPPQDSGAQEKAGHQDIQIDIPFPPYRLPDGPVETDRTEQPCKQGEDDRNSDLCAQWKAADAAKESADWTRRTFWLGLGGAVIGIFTLGSAFAAAAYAKRAAVATEKTIDETKRIGEAQARAYMLPQNIVVRYADGQFHSNGEISNSGQTPALKVKNWHGVAFGAEFLDEWATEDLRFYSESNVGAGEPIVIQAIGPIPPNIHTFAAVQARTMKAWIYGRVIYDDVFGLRHVTHYRYDITIRPDGSVFTFLSNTGNSAT